MESLLRLSGLLSDEDGGATDLGTLEKRLADKTAAIQKDPSKTVSTPIENREPSDDSTPHQQSGSPSDQSASPEPRKKAKNEEEVEALSDMMCSLVTNNCGETRYIGISILTAVVL